jgi:hypothetical protein
MMLRGLLGRIPTLMTLMAQTLATQTYSGAVRLEMIIVPTNEATTNEFKQEFLGRDKWQV